MDLDRGLFNVVTDQHERANKRHLEPERFNRLRDGSVVWEQPLSPISGGMSVDLADTDAEIAHPW